jgi:hypothetical protein
MDRITKSMMDEFMNDHNISITQESKTFEMFCNYCVLSRERSDSEELDINDLDEVTTGGTDDTGLDGIIILVDGKLLNSKAEVDEFKKRASVRVDFIFVQAKTSDFFDKHEIGYFGDGAYSFFAQFLEKSLFEEPNKKMCGNHRILEKSELATYLLTSCISKFEPKPTCKLYYITTSFKPINQSNRSHFDRKKKLIEETHIFGNVQIHPLGASELQDFYRSTKLKVQAVIEFPSHVSLPKIEGIKQSYIGTLPFSEFRKLIIDDDLGKVKPVIFEDNVRGFKGKDNNDVNKDIDNTLTSDNLDRFPVLNNGITIVSKSISRVANTFTLKDYQIVNGCQTSHILYNRKDIEGIDRLHVPVKIIEPDENRDDIVIDIIKATNFQTQVEKEALVSLEKVSKFSKVLEEYYKSFPVDDYNRLYYERQPGQYTGKDITKNRIVSIKNQLKVFAAMFLDEPHRALGNSGSLVKHIGTKIFCDNHSCTPYYTSSLAHYKLKNQFNKNPKSRKYQYHLLMSLRYLILNGACPKPENLMIDDSCNKINTVLEDPPQFMNYLDRAISIIEGLDDSLGDIEARDTFKLQTVTDELIKKLVAEC